jgi:hypothetical protein
LTQSAPPNLGSNGSRKRKFNSITLLHDKNKTKIGKVGHVHKKSRLAVSAHVANTNTNNFTSYAAGDDDDVILLISNPKVIPAPHKTNTTTLAPHSDNNNSVHNVNKSELTANGGGLDPLKAGIHLIKAIPQPQLSQETAPTESKAILQHVAPIHLQPEEMPEEPRSLTDYDDDGDDEEMSSSSSDEVWKMSTFFQKKMYK